MKLLGLHRDLSLAQYLAPPALGSSELGWLAVSPLRYRYLSDHPEARDADTEATLRGTALHAAVLEPERFARDYCGEPALDGIDSARPRATKAYREAVALLEDGGQTVLRSDMMAEVGDMAEAVLAHPQAAKVLKRAPEREVTALWTRSGGAMCRGRVDALGNGLAVDLKTCRDLASFSPWVIAKRAYYRQAAWYQAGLARVGHPVEHFFLVAVESQPPYDVGVFALDPDLLAFGRRECDRLLLRLAECEREGRWPGLYEDVQPALLTDVITATELEGEAANGSAER